MVFIGQEDPLLAMLEWTAQQMMQIEAEAKVGAQKGEQARAAVDFALQQDVCSIKKIT